MIIYTTLKQNREHNNNFVQYIDECFLPIGIFFDGNYIDEDDYTNWDKLYNDYTEKQIESIVLKGIKEEAKDKDSGILKYKKYLIDLEFAYDDLEKGIQQGLFLKSDIEKIFQKAKKIGHPIKKEDYDENGYFHTYGKYDLFDKYFPCDYDNNGECTNCENCN
jgi:hypothetical protein